MYQEEVESDAIFSPVPQRGADDRSGRGRAHAEEGSTEKDQRRGRDRAGEVRREPLRGRRIGRGRSRPYYASK